MINPDHFTSVLYATLVFALVLYFLLWRLVRIGLQRRFPREWAFDKAKKKLKWQKRRKRLGAMIGL